MKTFQDGDPVFGVMMNAIANLWPNGTAVLSGCAPTGSGAARQVTVAAGTVVIGGTVRPVSQQTKTLDAATFDRYDLLSVNSSGTVVVTKGTEERRVPALPANSVPIAICLVETGQTTLPADRIYDIRMDVLRLSALNIDANKDWGGKNIMNVGAIDTSNGNVGARSQFVDIAAGITTLRKSQVQTIVCSPGQTVTLMSFTIPATYSATTKSNCSLHVRAVNPRMIPNYGTITVYCNGASIGSAGIGELYDDYQWMPVFNTTGGFKAGDTIEIKLSAGGTSGFGPSVAEIRIYSSRASDVPACKVFSESGAW